MALPMPRLPPVTIACLPCNPRSMAFSPLRGITAILRFGADCSLGGTVVQGLPDVGRCVDRVCMPSKDLPPAKRYAQGAPIRLPTHGVAPRPHRILSPRANDTPAPEGT